MKGPSSAPSAGSGASASAGKSAGTPKMSGASANPFARQTAKRSLTRMSAGRRRTR